MNDLVVPALLARTRTADDAPLLELRQVSHAFEVPLPAAGLARLDRQRQRVDALTDVSLAIAPGEVLAVVGEHGAGKSTLARIAAGGLRPDAGARLWCGRDAATLGRRERDEAALAVQMIESDARSTLDPRHRVVHAVGEAPRAHRLIGSTQVIEYVGLQLNRVGIDPMRMRRFPGEFAAADGVRIALARALAVRPSIIVIDDALRGLDPTARAQLLNLLADVRAAGDVGLLYLCTDVAEALHLAERLAVLYLGRIVEQGPAAAVAAGPAHPYTRALLDAARGGVHAARPPARGNPAAPHLRPAGCAFHPRCAQAVRTCRDTPPSLDPLDAERWVACHVARPDEDHRAIVHTGQAT